MISVWLGDRSSWTGVRLAELDRSSFVDRSAGSWIGALVRGSEWIGALVCGSELVLSGSWIGVDRSAVRGLKLSGSWIGVDRSSGFWIGAHSLWFVDRSAVHGSELSGSWIGLDRSSGSLGRSSFSISLCVAVRGSELVVLLCVRLFCVSLLSFSLCCCAWIDPVLLCVRLFSVSLLSSLCVAVRGDVIQK